MLIYKDVEKELVVKERNNNVILVLEDELKELPWESLKCLKGESVYRVECLEQLKGWLKSKKKEKSLK